MFYSFDAVDSFASLLLLWFMVLLPSAFVCPATSHFWRLVHWSGFDTSYSDSVRSHAHVKTATAFLQHRYTRAFLKALRWVIVAEALCVYDTAGLQITTAYELVSYDIRLPFTVLGYTKSTIQFLTKTWAGTVILVAICTIIFSIHNIAHEHTGDKTCTQNAATQTVLTEQPEVPMPQSGDDKIQSLQQQHALELEQQDRMIRGLTSDNQRLTETIGHKEERTKQADRASTAAEDRARTLQEDHQSALTIKDRHIADLIGRAEEREATICELEIKVSTLTNNLAGKERSTKDAAEEERDRKSEDIKAQDSIRKAVDDAIKSLRESQESLQQQTKDLESQLSAQSLHCQQDHVDRSELTAKQKDCQSSHVNKSDADVLQNQHQNHCQEHHIDQSRALELHNGAVQGLNDEISSQQARINQLTADITAKHNAIAILNQQAGNAGARIGELEDTIKAKDGEMAMLNQQIGNLNTSISEVESTVRDRDARIAQLMEEGRQIQQQLEDAKAQLDANVTEQSDLKSRLESVGKQLQEKTAESAQHAAKPEKIEAELKTTKINMLCAKDIVLEFATHVVLCDKSEGTAEDELTERQTSVRHNAQVLAKMWEEEDDGKYVATLHGPNAKHGLEREKDRTSEVLPRKRAREATYNPLLNPIMGPDELFDRIVDYSSDTSKTFTELLNKSASYGFSYGALTENEERGEELLALRRMNWQIRHIIQACDAWKDDEEIKNYLTYVARDLSEHLKVNPEAEASEDDEDKLPIYLFVRFAERVSRLSDILNEVEGASGDIAEEDLPIAEEEVGFDQELVGRQIKPLRKKK
ncbi:hypothetical protein K490DRAFT_61051 [Saccharata proteae CBS 121410]|uniref:Uncharacterized protein n=1 Tax=Saccharata proteae CBS 121410 TaxID=1314787 RepID=A0A9P4LZP0_9PEZI|nr:hypothetical protein K490DRAFT_61051 [Saccharata proteae CBS 121410]